MSLLLPTSGLTCNPSSHATLGIVALPWEQGSLLTTLRTPTNYSSRWVGGVSHDCLKRFQGAFNVRCGLYQRTSGLGLEQDTFSQELARWNGRRGKLGPWENCATVAEAEPIKGAVQEAEESSALSSQAGTGSSERQR